MSMTQEISPTPASTSTGAKKSSRRWIAGAVIGLAALAGIWFAANLYYMNAKTELTRLETSQNWLEISLALDNYSTTYQRLPYPSHRSTYDPKSSTFQIPSKYDPDGPATSSWRFAIAPFTDMHMLGLEWNELPWTDEANATWRGASNPFAHLGWKGRLGDPRNPADIPSTTQLLAITGPNTAFGDGKDELPRAIEDVESDTIIVVETRNSGLHWMQPGDFDIRNMPRTINAKDGKGISSIHPSGFHVLFADGAVWLLSHETPFEDLEKFFTIKGAKKHDRRTLLKKFRLDEAMTPEEEEESNG